MYFLHGDIAFEYTLNDMDAKEQFGFIHSESFLHLSINKLSNKGPHLIKNTIRGSVTRMLLDRIKQSVDKHIATLYFVPICTKGDK